MTTCLRSPALLQTSTYCNPQHQAREREREKERGREAVGVRERETHDYYSICLYRGLSSQIMGVGSRHAWGREGVVLKV